MNLLTIVAAATAAFIVAFLWNGPVFGKVGMKLAGRTSPPPAKISQIALNYLVFLVTAAVMAGVFWIAFASPLMGARTWYRGMIIAWWLWLGFNVTTSFIEVIWNGKPWKLWLFECAAAFVVFSVIGAMLGAWY